MNRNNNFLVMSSIFFTAPYCLTRNADNNTGLLFIRGWVLEYKDKKYRAVHP